MFNFFLFFFEKGCKVNERFQGKLDLEAYLLKPMQRLTRMPLLVKGILNSTPDTNPDYKFVKAGTNYIYFSIFLKKMNYLIFFFLSYKALRAANEALQHINSECAKNDEVQRLIRLREKICIEFPEVNIDFIKKQDQ